jgi:hypothetical protein
MPKPCVLLAIAILLPVATGLVRAGDNPSPQAILDKAIKAHGGAEALAKFKAATFKVKGTSYAVGEGTPYTGDFAVQHPAHFRVELNINIDGKDFRFVQVINGNKGWRIIPGKDKAEAMKKDILDEQRGQMEAGWVTHLLPLRDKAYKLSPVGQADVAGRKTLGIRAEHAGQRPVNLFFDKESGLLVKSEFTVKDEFAGDTEVLQEIIYKDYKTAEATGVKYPTRATTSRAGKRFDESEVTEFQMHEHLDDSMFGEP